MKRLTTILFAVGLALMARAETRLGDVVMKDVVVLEPVDKTNLLNAINALTNGAALGATALQPSWAATGHVATAGAADFATTSTTADFATTADSAFSSYWADSAMLLSPEHSDGQALAAATAHTNSPAAHPDIRALIETAWQNPTNAADWTWTSNGREITLTNYSGPNAVVIPDMLDGLPVTGFGGIFTDNPDITSVGGGANIKAVGDYAFFDCAALNSVSLPACTTVGDSAFAGCAALNSVYLPACTTVGDSAFSWCGALSTVSMPACTTVGDYAFYYCGSLNSVSLPACTTVGDYAFYYCGSLNSVSLPACTTVGVEAFRNCWALSSVTFGQNAPAPAANVFYYSTPTIYVSNPHATGWGDTWNGRPVVRAASMADISTHNTDGTAHADIRALTETSIIAPLYESGTNVTVTSTQSVYSVAVTGAGPVGIDWSGLALDGTGRAEVTLRLNVTDWGGTNVTFSPSLTFDRTPEILVTGVWEFAASTIDGVTTRVSQTWPECCGWEQMTGFAGTATYGSAGQPMFDATTDVVYVSIPNDGRIVRTIWTTYASRYVPERGMVVDIGIPNSVDTRPEIVQAGFTNRLLQGSRTQTFVGVAPSVGSGAAVFLRIRPDGDTATWTINGILHAVQTRALNSNERAAYAAGWRP
jgi:hypothetical protein